MKVERLKIDNMRHELHYEFHKNVLVIIDRLTGEYISVLELAALLTPYRNAFEVEQQVLDIVVKSKFSNAIAEADHRRGQTYTGFMNLVK